MQFMVWRWRSGRCGWHVFFVACPFFFQKPRVLLFWSAAFGGSLACLLSHTFCFLFKCASSSAPADPRCTWHENQREPSCATSVDGSARPKLRVAHYSPRRQTCVANEGFLGWAPFGPGARRGATLARNVYQPLRAARTPCEHSRTDYSTMRRSLSAPKLT